MKQPRGWWLTGFPLCAGVDGSARTPLTCRHAQPNVDVGGKMYWTDRRTDKIQRANRDGSGIEEGVVTGVDACRLAVSGSGL